MRFTRFAICLGICVIGFLSVSLFAQDTGQVSFASAAGSKFANLPGAPTCMTASVQRGDPSKGAAVMLLKFSSGCVVPWHWHTANEQLMIVSGRGKAEMKDEKTANLAAGDFLFLPSKHHHQFTCASTTCLLFDVTEAAFDIHYVDASGKEIPPEEALKAKAKTTKK